MASVRQEGSVISLAWGHAGLLVHVGKGCSSAVTGCCPCRLQAICSGSSGTVKHIDWSFAVIDGPANMHGRHILQSNDSSREVLHWDGLTGRKVTHNQRDCLWSSWTCSLGFPVLGIWPDFSDGMASDRNGWLATRLVDQKCPRLHHFDVLQELTSTQYAAPKPAHLSTRRTKAAAPARQRSHGSHEVPTRKSPLTGWLAQVSWPRLTTSLLSSFFLTLL